MLLKTNTFSEGPAKTDDGSFGARRPMLTDSALKALKPKEKIYKVADRGGMHVHVTPQGAVSFRLDYRLNGRRETGYLGKYGPSSLSLA